MKEISVSLAEADWFLILRALESKALGLWEAPEPHRDDVVRVATSVQRQALPLSLRRTHEV